MADLKRNPYPSELDYFRKRPDVAGMATEDNKYIINPFSGLPDENKKMVAKNEMARLLMRSGKVPEPLFGLTERQRNFFSTINNGQPYGAPRDVRGTIIGRVISNDPSAQDITPDQQRYADMIARMLQGG